MSENEWAEIQSIDGELWKPIKGYENLYMVSNMGRVRNKTKVLNTSSKGTEYSHVMLCDGDSDHRKTMSVHRLVAEAFVYNPNPEKNRIVNHKDENKKNNKADSLEWCDHSYNLSYGSYPKQNSLRRKLLLSNRDNNWRCKRVRCVETGSDWRSAKDVEETIGIDASSIRKCCKGNRKTAGGFKWIYITDDAPTVIEAEGSE